MPLKSAHEIDSALEQWQRKSEITLSVAGLLVAAAELAQTLPVEERVMLADCMRWFEAQGLEGLLAQRHSEKTKYVE